MYRYRVCIPDPGTDFLFDRGEGNRTALHLYAYGVMNPPHQKLIEALSLAVSGAP